MDIVRVLEHYGSEGVPEGRNRPLRCPFHDDRHASASVDTHEGLFMCHAGHCGAMGNAVTLIAQQEGIPYEAAKRRAEEITGETNSGVRGGTSGKPRGSLLPDWARDRYQNGGSLPPWLHG